MHPTYGPLTVYWTLVCLSSVISFFKPISRDESFAQHAKLSAEIAQEFTPSKPKRPVGRPRGSGTKRKLTDLDTLSSTTSSSTTPEKHDGHVNWWVPHKIDKIEEAVLKKPRSFKDALDFLRAAYPGMFDKLCYENLRRWFHHTTLKLHPQYEKRKQDNAKRFVPLKHMRTENSGQKSPVSESTQEEIAKLLTGLRQSCITLNPFIMQPLIKEIINEHQPELLRENGGQMTVSYSWIRRFVWRRFGWVVRRATQATRKRPESWKQDIDDMIMRAAILVSTNDIKPEMMINLDQTGIHVIPNQGQMTFEKKGSKQVDVAGSDDKRQITAVVTSTAAGDLLPIQLIFEGKTERSLPSASASKYCKNEGFHITNSSNHWSSFNTMQQYLEHIIMPYVQQTRDRLQLSDDSKVILVLDCWAVHRGQEFREFVSRCYPFIILLYIPAGCTGEAQPADITIQRAIKIAFKKCFQSWVSTVVFTQLKMGVTPDKTKLDFSMPMLRELIPGWMLSAYHHVNNNTNMVISGWNQSGLMRAWDQDEQMRALKHNHTTNNALFETKDKRTKHPCPVPTKDEKKHAQRIDEIEDDDEYDTMSDSDDDSLDWEREQEREQEQEQEQGQEYKCNTQEQAQDTELATTLASIAISRTKRTIKPKVK